MLDCQFASLLIFPSGHLKYFSKKKKTHSHNGPNTFEFIDPNVKMKAVKMAEMTTVTLNPTFQLWSFSRHWATGKDRHAAILPVQYAVPIIDP